MGTDGHTGGRAERLRMVAGRTCRSRGPELTRQRASVKPALHEDNSAHPGAEDPRAELLRTLLGSVGEHVWLEPSFRCDCGSQITMGSGACANHDRAILGARAVIGAGSVVTRDVPPDVVAAGNPCRVLRPITDEDRAAYRATSGATGA